MLKNIIDRNEKHFVSISNENPYGIIYRVTNKINGKIYIGQTIDKLYKRKRGHYNDARRKRENIYFRNALLKYKKSDFVWDIIDQAYSKEELGYLEKYWIKLYNSINKDIGYNIQKGGINPGPTEECKKKISKTIKKQYKEGRVNHLLGKAFLKKWKNKKIKKRISNSGAPRGTHNSPKTEFPSIKIKCIKTGEIFNSLQEAARKFDINHTNFTAYFKGKTKSVAGFQWEKI